MLQALRGNYDLSLLTWTKSVEPDEINRVYGTALTAADFKLLGPPPPLRAVFDLVAKWRPEHDFQKACLLDRLARRMKNDYDLVISASDEMDFGRTGIQYVHYPSFKNAYESEKGTVSMATIARWWRLFAQRCRPWRILSGLSFDGVKENFTLVNSDWTGNVVRQLYGIDTLTVYPPAAGEFSDVAWEHRKNRFVCIGRFVPHKRLEMVINILAAVRAQGHDVGLQLIGLVWNDAPGRAYHHKIMELAREHSSWVSLAEKIGRRELAEIVSHSRYGIHAAESEPFGIAVAEMVRAGCIAFTGRVGGQAEIIGGDERLLFDTVEEGTEKILAVLNSPDQQLSLRQHLAGRGTLFDSDGFVSRIKEAVQRFEERQSAGRGALTIGQVPRTVATAGDISPTSHRRIQPGPAHFDEAAGEAERP
jgi:glycosyltransferase involved in cell wall biosynthesis